MSESLKNINKTEEIFNETEEEVFDEIELKDFIHFDPCQICQNITSDPINLSTCSRLLEVNVALKNVCRNKEVTVGCIVMDSHDNILAFKSETFVIKGNCGCNCGGGHCTNTDKKFRFILPKGDLCKALNLKLKVIANYTHPCRK